MSSRDLSRSKQSKGCGADNADLDDTLDYGRSNLSKTKINTKDLINKRRILSSK